MIVFSNEGVFDLCFEIREREARNAAAAGTSVYGLFYLP
jgi:hypothetical protein